MLDVHAPAGTTSAGYVHPRDFHNLNCKSIRPPIAASEFMQSAPVPAIPFATPLEGETSREYRRVLRIYLVFYALENPFEMWWNLRDVGEGREGMEAFGIFVKADSWG